MSDERCPECGSWERSCNSPTPVADCGCQRCLRARLATAEGELARLNGELWDCKSAAVQKTRRHAPPEHEWVDGKCCWCGLQRAKIEVPDA